MRNEDIVLFQPQILNNNTNSEYMLQNMIVLLCEIALRLPERVKDGPPQ